MEKELTGYPSIDMPWLQYYDEGVYEKTLNIPKDKSVWDFYRPILLANNNIPAIKYFNNTISREDFVLLVENWARTFKSIGVEKDEMVPVYGVYSPDLCAMFFALNAIGAHPYFEKLDITADALKKETEGSKIAVVHDALWNKTIDSVFMDEQFKKIIVCGTADSMKFPLKEATKLKSYIDTKKQKLSLPDSSKIIWADKAREIGNYYTGDYSVDFKKDRLAVITSSSGTTSSVVKGIKDSNESILSNILGTAYSKPNYIEGKTVLASTPPTASTSLNCLFLLPLYKNMTVILDPRVGEDLYYKQIMSYKPSITIITGSYLESFYRKVEQEQKKGKNVDLSFADFYTIGGSGTTPDKLDKMNRIMRECNAPSNVVVGYGSSEFFGVVSVDKINLENPKKNLKSVTDVGLPLAGFKVGIFDEEGKELKYNERGEIWISGPAKMHGYFNKPETTAACLSGEWFKTGDIGEIDENGYIYYYGRKNNYVIIDDKKIYLFDIANLLRDSFALEDCMAEVKKLNDGTSSIVIYFVQKETNKRDTNKLCEEMDNCLEKYNIIIDGYKEHSIALPTSPTTLKPRTRDLDGFIKYVNGENINITYEETAENDVLIINKEPFSKQKILSKKKLV